MSNIQKNIELVLRMYDALNAQDIERHHEYWTDDMIWHGPPGFGDIPGIEGFKYEVLKPFYKTFPDYHVKDEIQVANGDWVAATGILTGTPQDEWMGIPASGESIVMRYSDFWRVENGKLAENWVMVDDLGVMLQLAGRASAPLPVAKDIYKTPNHPSPTQPNLDLVHRMMEALNEHDIGAQDRFWKKDMVWHGPPGFGDVHGLDDFKCDVIGVFDTAFPDFGVTADIELTDDSWAAATGIVAGTHLGDWFGIRATGKRVEVRFSGFWRIENGKLAENWAMIDHVGVLQQTGVDPLAIRI